MISLHTLRPAKGSKRTKKRIGRGIGSGKGAYSTRGVKGQRARSGGTSGLKLKGFRANLLNIPKLRGFNSPHVKPEEVTLKQLEKNFEKGDTVNLISLYDKKLISSRDSRVKILGSGELTKSLTFEKCLFTKGARSKIEKVGGSIV